MDALYVNGDIVGHVVPGSGCVLLGIWLGARVVYVQQRPSAEDSIWLRRFGLLTGVVLLIGICYEGYLSVDDGGRFFAFSLEEDTIHQVCYAGFLPMAAGCLLEAHRRVPRGSHQVSFAVGLLNYGAIFLWHANSFTRSTAKRYAHRVIALVALSAAGVALAAPCARSPARAIALEALLSGLLMLCGAWYLYLALSFYSPWADWHHPSAAMRLAASGGGVVGAAAGWALLLACAYPWALVRAAATRRRDAAAQLDGARFKALHSTRHEVEIS